MPQHTLLFVILLWGTVSLSSCLPAPPILGELWLKQKQKVSFKARAPQESLPKAVVAGTLHILARGPTLEASRLTTAEQHQRCKPVKIPNEGLETELERVYDPVDLNVSRSQAITPALRLEVKIRAII